MLDLREARPCSAEPVQALGERRPGTTLPLPTAPMAPVQRTAQSALDTAVPGVVVAWHPVGGVVAPPPPVQPPGARASRQVPGLVDPCRYPSARRLELLARGAALDTRHAVAIWPPRPRASQQRDAPPQAGLDTTAAQAGGVSGATWRLHGGSRGGNARDHRSRLFVVPEGAATVRLHDRGTPALPGVVPRHRGQDGGEAPPWGRAGCWRSAGAVGRQPASRPPCADQPEQGAVLAALAPPGQAPRVVQLVDDAWHVGLDQVAERPVGAVAGAVTDRLQRPPSGAIAVAASPPVRLLDGPPQRRAGPGHPVVLESRRPVRPVEPLAFGLSPRRTRVARSRGVWRRCPNAVMLACPWAW